MNWHLLIDRCENSDGYWRKYIFNLIEIGLGLFNFHDSAISEHKDSDDRLYE